MDRRLPATEANQEERLPVPPEEQGRSEEPQTPRVAAGQGDTAATPAVGSLPDGLPTDPGALSKIVLAGFHGENGEVRPAQTSMLYRVALTLVTLGVLLLPVLYCLLIVAVGYLTYVHAVGNQFLLDQRRSHIPNRLAWFFYFTPLIAGPTLILFMLKPLLSRQAASGWTLSLKEADEPVLFQYVRELCARVHAPIPSAILVDLHANASASFRRGIASFLGRDLALTIGLSVARGLTLQQLSGVLAHEFGHFSQGAGMRVSYLLRYINHWFARVVYERDRWDERLAERSKQGTVGTMACAACIQFLVACTRKILWVLMHASHAVSCFMLRQMEFDADNCEAQLAGSNCFAATTHRFRLLSVGEQIAWNDLQVAYSHGWMVDDFTQLVELNSTELPAGLVARVNKSMEEESTAWFDTHPADRDRISAVQQAAFPGIFRSELPATVLFRDFDNLARSATADFYVGKVGLSLSENTLMSADAIKRSLPVEVDYPAVLRRFSPGCFVVWRAWQLPSPGVGGGAIATTARLRLAAIRERLALGRNDYCVALQDFMRAVTSENLARQAIVMIQAGARIDASAFELRDATAEAAGAAVEAAVVRRGEITARLATYEKLLADRLLAAIECASLAEIAVELRTPDECSRLVDAANTLGEIAATLSRIRQGRQVVQCLASHIKKTRDNAKRNAVLRKEAAAHYQALKVVYDRLKGLNYPLDHLVVSSVSDRLLFALPDLDVFVSRYFALVDEYLARLDWLYEQTLGRLAWIAEEVERQLGLEPLNVPELTSGDASNVV